MMLDSPDAWTTTLAEFAKAAEPFAETGKPEVQR
jgi:hypothetical protein